MRIGRCLSTLALLYAATHCFADDPVFSGPQPGEALPPLRVIAVGGEQTGEEVDPIQAADGKPTLLVFVHKLTRPGVALTRGLTNYAKAQPDAVTGIIWLDDDKAKAEEYLTRARNSLSFKAPLGVSVDGGEGPGAYGLNRNVELTILVASENKVTANYALVQPSVTEGPKIAADLARLLDQDPPTAEEFEKFVFAGREMANRNMRPKRGDAPQAGQELRSMMRKVIAENPSESELREAIEAVDAWVGENESRQTQLGRMAGAVLERGLGGEAAQKVIRQWHEKYGAGEE